MSLETEQVTTIGNGSAKQPLLIETVMDCLFSHLDLPSLKVARVVCKAWKKAASSHILEHGAVRFIEDEAGAAGATGDGVEPGLLDIDNNLTKEMKELSLWEKKSSLGLEEDEQRGRFRNYILVKGRSDIPGPLPEYFVKFGHLVKSLKLDGHHHIENPNYVASHPHALEASHFTLEFLVKILETCPNLEELEASCLEDEFNSTDLSWASSLEKLCQRQELKLKTLTLLGETGGHQKFIHMMLKVCPLLEDLSVTYHFSAENIDPLVDHFNLSRLRRLNIVLEPNEVTTECLQAMCAQPLPNLSFFCITIPKEVDEVALNAMLEHLSRNLRHLRLANVTRVCSESSDEEVSLEFSPRIPSTMTSLETLELGVRCNKLLIGALESAINLPRLKRLILYREPIDEILENYETPGGAEYNFTQCWLVSMSLPASWADSRHEGLKTLQLPCGLTQAEHLIQLLAVFPGVRDLRLQNPTPEVIRAVFAEGTHLERLSIRLLTFPKDIDSILTGLRPKICSHMAKESKYLLKDPNQVTDWGPGLRDMKNLQYFEFRQWNQTKWLTEVSLWQGLMYLTRAYHLELGLGPSHRLSESSLAALKSNLGPRCFIHIDTRIRDCDPPLERETPETRLCYWEFWPREKTNSGKPITCSGTCCQIYD